MRSLATQLLHDPARARAVPVRRRDAQGLRLRADRRHDLGRLLVGVHRRAGAHALEGARAGLPHARAPHHRPSSATCRPTPCRWAAPRSTSRRSSRAAAAAASPPRRTRPTCRARSSTRWCATSASRRSASRRAPAPAAARPAAAAPAPTAAARAPARRPRRRHARAARRPSATATRPSQAQEAAQPQAREAALMAMLVWAMMGIALWHFTIFLPDRFWGGIVGAFLGALFGAVLIGLAVNGFTIPGQDDTDLVSALEAIPGAIAGHRRRLLPRRPPGATRRTASAAAARATRQRAAALLERVAHDRRTAARRSRPPRCASALGAPPRARRYSARAAIGARPDDVASAVSPSSDARACRAPRADRRARGAGIAADACQLLASYAGSRARRPRSASWRLHARPSRPRAGRDRGLERVACGVELRDDRGGGRRAGAPLPRALGRAQVGERVLERDAGGDRRRAARSASSSSSSSYRSARISARRPRRVCANPWVRRKRPVLVSMPAASARMRRVRIGSAPDLRRARLPSSRGHSFTAVRRQDARFDIAPYDFAAAERLGRELGVSHVLAQVLVRRGLGDPVAAQRVPRRRGRAIRSTPSAGCATAPG